MDRYKYDTEVQVWRYAAAKYYNDYHPNNPIDLSQFYTPPLPDTRWERAKYRWSRFWDAFWIGFWYS
mgnify:CR=1 FL=1